MNAKIVGNTLVIEIALNPCPGDEQERQNSGDRLQPRQQGHAGAGAGQERRHRPERLHPQGSESHTTQSRSILPIRGLMDRALFVPCLRHSVCPSQLLRKGTVMPETSATERGLLPSEEQLETARTLATSMARQTGEACWHVLCCSGHAGRRLRQRHPVSPQRPTAHDVARRCPPAARLRQQPTQPPEERTHESRRHHPDRNCAIQPPSLPPVSAWACLRPSTARRSSTRARRRRGCSCSCPAGSIPSPSTPRAVRSSTTTFRSTGATSRRLHAFQQAYAVEVVRIQARKKGYVVSEQQLQDGSVKLQIQEGT